MKDYEDVLVTLDDGLFNMIDDTLSDLVRQNIAIDQNTIACVCHLVGQRLAIRMAEHGTAWAAIQKSVDDAE